MSKELNKALTEQQIVLKCLDSMALSLADYGHARPAQPGQGERQWLKN